MLGRIRVTGSLWLWSGLGHLACVIAKGLLVSLCRGHRAAVFRGGKVFCFLNVGRRGDGSVGRKNEGFRWSCDLGFTMLLVAGGDVGSGAAEPWGVVDFVKSF